MKKNTDAQKAKIARLVELNILEPGVDIIQNVRAGVVFAQQNGILERWEDFGNHYNLVFRNRKPMKVRATEVGEVIVDRLIEVNDPTYSEPKPEVTPEKPKAPPRAPRASGTGRASAAKKAND